MQKHPVRLGLIILLIVPLLSGCELFRKIGSNKGSEAAGYALAEEIAENAFSFNQLAISGKADIRSPEMSLGASYRIHIQKDQQILIRISKIVEVFKILIRTDSIFVQDKLNQHYYACDFALASEYLGMKANFEMIQALFLGDYYPLPPELVLGSPPRDNPLMFSGNLSDSRVDYYLDRELRKLIRMSAFNPKLEGPSNAYYENFEKVSGQNFPMSLRVEVPSPLDSKISFNHKRVQVNPNNLSFSFDVPASYSLQDCP